MKKISILFALFILTVFVSCGQKKKETTAKNQNKVDIPVYNFNELEPLLYTETNKTYIINFWAMWCAPCVKELPYIEEYERKNKNVEVILVSLDFPEDIETKLKPFLAKKKISSKVVVLDDPDANTWINKIDKNWSGAIPFTIIFNAEKRFFYERSFEDLHDLETEILKNFN